MSWPKNELGKSLLDQDRVIRSRNKEIKELREARDELRTIVGELHAEIRDMQAAPISLDATVRELQEDLERLRDRNNALAKQAAPLTLDALEAAWEAAEQTSECREGDVLIEDFGPDHYHVYPADRDHFHLPRAIRVLSRAPKREPWQDLADVLEDFAIHDHNGEEYPDILARRLHERGVRVTGGDES